MSEIIELVWAIPQIPPKEVQVVQSKNIASLEKPCPAIQEIPFVTSKILPNNRLTKGILFFNSESGLHRIEKITM